MTNDVSLRLSTSTNIKNRAENPIKKHLIIIHTMLHILSQSANKALKVSRQPLTSLIMPAFIVVPCSFDPKATHAINRYLIKNVTVSKEKIKLPVAVLVW